MSLLQAIPSFQASLLLAILQVVSLLQGILSSQPISFFDIRVILQVMLELCHSIFSSHLITSSQIVTQLMPSSNYELQSNRIELLE
jgi:hypothetical protein